MPFNKQVFGNLLSDYGYGLMAGKNWQQGLALGAERGQQMQPYRDQQQLAAEQKSRLEQQTNATIKWLQDNGRTDLLAAVQGGMPIGDAWKAALTPQTPLNVSPGETLIDPTTRQPIYSAPAAATPAKPPTVESRWNAQSGREEKVQWDPTTGTWVPFGGQKVAQSDDPTLNMNQSAAALYADRMVEANKIISEPTLGPAQIDFWNPIKANVPFIGNGLVGSDYQRVEQAQRDFVNAVLRRESGAVISPAEFENAKKQYFPQPYDSQAVIDQKAANRATAIAGLQRAAGPAYTPPGNGDQPSGETLPAPPGVDPNLWQYLTPEEQQLWLN